MFRKKPNIALNFLYPFPFVALFIVSTVNVFFDLGLTHSFAFLLLVVLILPALIYNLYIKRKVPGNFYEHSDDLPNPLRVEYDLPLYKIYSIISGLFFILSFFVTIIIFFIYGNTPIARSYVLTTLLFSIPVVINFRCLARPFIISLSPAEIINNRNKTYSWEDVESVEIDDWHIKINVVSDKNDFDLVVIDYDQISPLDFYRARAYIMKYVKSELIAIEGL